MNLSELEDSLTAHTEGNEYGVKVTQSIDEELCKLIPLLLYSQN